MRARILILAALAFSSSGWASEPIAAVHHGRSATKARDVNGFELGMPMADAAKRLQIKFVQGELVQAELDGIRYDFGVCPSGRIFRIESSQPLGRFIIDEEFTDRLGAKLAAKYGTPANGTGDNLSWELVEPVRYTDGAVHPFKTNLFSALVSSQNGSEPVSLNLMMIDFRICWGDAERRNRLSRESALQALTF